MVSKKVVDWVRKAVTAGKTTEEIFSELRETGYSDSEISEAVREAGGEPVLAPQKAYYAEAGGFETKFLIGGISSIIWLVGIIIAIIGIALSASSMLAAMVSPTLGAAGAAGLSQWTFLIIYIAQMITAIGLLLFGFAMTGVAEKYGIPFLKIAGYIGLISAIIAVIGGLLAVIGISIGFTGLGVIFAGVIVSIIGVLGLLIFFILAGIKFIEERQTIGKNSCVLGILFLFVGLTGGIFLSIAALVTSILCAWFFFKSK